MLKRLLQLLALSPWRLSASLALAQRTPLLVYTALETDQLKAYQGASIEARSRTSRSAGCATRPA